MTVAIEDALSSHAGKYDVPFHGRTTVFLRCGVWRSGCIRGGDDDRNPFVFDLFADRAADLLHVLGQGYHDADVFGLHAQSGADLLEASRAGRILAAGHAGSEVVRDYDGDVALFIHGIQQGGHARVGEGRVADYGYRRELSAVGSALGHRDRSAHLHAGVDRPERGSEPSV